MLQSYPDVLERFVASDDIAAVAAVALTTLQYDNKTVTIQGPAGVSARQQIQLISQQLVRPIEVVLVSEDEFRQSTPIPAPIVNSGLTIKRFRQERGADWQAPTDAIVTGTVTVEQFIAQHKQEFAD